MVEAVAVVVKAGFYIKVFRRETVAEEIGERAGLCNRIAEGVVCILCNGIAVGVEVARDVAVVVVAGNIELELRVGVGDGEEQQASDAARALQRAGEVLAPVISNCGRRAARVGDAFLDEIPAVVEERVRRRRRDLPDAATKAIVATRT